MDDDGSPYAVTRSDLIGFAKVGAVLAAAYSITKLLLFLVDNGLPEAEKIVKQTYPPGYIKFRLVMTAATIIAMALIFTSEEACVIAGIGFIVAFAYFGAFGL